MNQGRLRRFLFIQDNSIGYRLKISFAFFFLVPILGFFYFAYRYEMFGKEDSTYYLLAILTFSLFGFVILRQIIDSIQQIAREMSDATTRLKHQSSSGQNELENIAGSFQTLNAHLDTTSAALGKRMDEIQALRDLSQLSFTIIDGQTLILQSLQRAVEVTGAAGGAVFELIKPNRNYYLVCRAITGKGLKTRSGKAILLGQHPLRPCVESSASKILEKTQDPGWRTVFGEEVAQIVAIPMFRTKGFSGVAVVTNTGPDPWPEDILRFLTPFFSTVGAALKIQGLGLREQARSEDLKTVLYIIKMINSGLTEREMMLGIGEKLQEVIPHSWMGVAMTDEQGSELRLAYSLRKDDPSVRPGMVFPANNSLFQTSMRSKGLLHIEDVDRGPDYFEKHLMGKLGLTSCLVAGLSFKGSPVGVICLGHEASKAFGRKHGRMLGMIAEGLSLAIEQARLLRRAKTKAGELEVLNRVGRALTSSTFNVDRVLNYILEMISSLINVDAGSILLLEGDDLVFKVALGEASEQLKGTHIKFGQGVAGWVAATGEPMLVTDADQNPHFYGGMDTKTGFKTKDLVCVPMIVNGRTVGVIELLNKLKGTFNEEDLRTLRSVASSAAVALENSRLYSESVHMVKKERLIRNIFQKYVPEEVANEVLEQGDRDHLTMGEKRLVTLVNVDIRGYSSMSKTAPAEDMVSVLNYFFMVVGNTILKHKGILDKYLGDGLMAIFGAPVATRNPALDAVMSAIDVVREIDNINRFSMERCGVPLKIGISINTGEAIVGNIGFDKKMEYTAIGDVVNDTFLLQDLTRKKANCILVSNTTFDKVKPFVIAEKLGLHTLGPHKSTLDVYEITGKSTMSDLEYLVHQARTG